MYSLQNQLDSVKGIGEVLSAKLAKKNLFTISDFLLNLPLRYEDFSNTFTIEELKNLKPNSPFTIKAKIHSSSQFYRNRRNILSATITDKTGKIKCTWFNNRFLAPQLKKAEKNNDEFFFSGKTNAQNSLTQPRVEKTPTSKKSSNSNTKHFTLETIHTGRLVPVYTSTINIPQGKLRRLQKEILDHLKIKNDVLTQLVPTQLSTHKFLFPDLKTAFQQSHFPDNKERIVQARERFALEEILDLIQQSKTIKKHWRENNSAYSINISKETIPKTIPFSLTSAQKKSTQEILSDLKSEVSMNRLLIGDVGSGKTVVAGIACYHILRNNHNVAFVAPTQILAEQHAISLQKIFPDFKIELITAKTSSKFQKAKSPTLYIGTHALINQIKNIKPALIIYDEQHRFGVNHRSSSLTSNTSKTPNKKNKSLVLKSPHILTMSATPIPRSLMLTIFSHLQLSIIDELPTGRLPIKTWLVPEKKRLDSFSWISQELLAHRKKTATEGLAIVVCPFIDPSHHLAFENIASATETYEKVKNIISKISKSKLTTALLHGKLSQKKKDVVIKQLFDKKINILVTTPIVEVGLDLPNANIIVIESAQRFGLASLHQLRGRVGRAGQKSYCLLFSSEKSNQKPLATNYSSTNNRLNIFAKETNGIKLAEFDLKNRGAGSIFGTIQSGFSNLKFASWTNLKLISQAQKITTLLEKKGVNWQPLWKASGSKHNATTPLAN